MELFFNELLEAPWYFTVFMGAMAFVFGVVPLIVCLGIILERNLQLQAMTKTLAPVNVTRESTP